MLLPPFLYIVRIIFFGIFRYVVRISYFGRFWTKLAPQQRSPLSPSSSTNERTRRRKFEEMEAGVSGARPPPAPPRPRPASLTSSRPHPAPPRPRLAFGVVASAAGVSASAAYLPTSPRPATPCRKGTPPARPSREISLPRVREQDQ